MSANVSSPALIVGVMSGTSLDGMDLALCEIAKFGTKYSYKILKSKTLSYSKQMEHDLAQAHLLSAENYFALNASYGRFIGEEILKFLENSEKPVAIASHGHTVFHQPAKGFSTQIGCGATIAAVTGIQTVCDFRSLDVALNGQGAPLVPIGDKLLFSEFDACLNIGGIANISFDENAGRKAYDICPANMLLNHLASKKGLAYDSEGRLAGSGKINIELLYHLNGLPYYKQKGARSMGREFFEKEILPLLKLSSVEDMMATAVEHIAIQISNDVNSRSNAKVFVTGGGAFNTFLTERIQKHSHSRLIIPEKEIVNFKEALIFAFLGYLRLNNQINSLSTVTGAVFDSIGGAVYAGR